VVLDLAEGQRSAKGNKHERFASAHGSANEVKAALEVACAWGWIGDAKAPRKILDQLLAISWRLTHRAECQTWLRTTSRARNSV